jgi:hypothetical protein
MSSFGVVEAAYRELLAPITYLQENNGGSIVFAATPTDVMGFTRYATPAVVFVLSLEEIVSRKNEAVGEAVFATMFHWDCYVIASNFSADQDGRTEGLNIGPGVATDPGAYQMIDDLTAALLGKGLHTTTGWPAGAPDSKIFIGSTSRRGDGGFARLEWTGADRIVYRVSWRNAWMRIGV